MNKTIGIEKSKNKRLHRDLLEHTPFPALISGLVDHRIVYINKWASRLLGISRSKAVGQNISSFYETPADLERLVETLRLQGNARSLEASLKTYKGNKFWALVSAEQVAYEDQPAATIFFEDITERKLAEEKLQRELSINAALAKLYYPLVETDIPVLQISTLILQQAQALTGSENGYVGTIDPQNGSLVLHTLSEMLEDVKCQIGLESQSMVFPRGERGRYPGLWGYSLNTHKPFFSNIPEKHPSVKGTPDGHIPIKNFLSVPILLQNELVGQISLANKPSGFDNEDLYSIGRLAEYFAMAIQRRRIEEAALKARQVAEALQAAGVALSTTLDFNLVLDLVLEQASRVLTYDSAGVLLMRDDSMVVLACRGFENNDALIGFKVPLQDNHPNKKVIQTKRTVIESNVQKYSTFQKPPFNSIKSWMGIPLTAHEHLNGILTLDSKIPNHFTPQDERVAAAFAAQVSLALENSRLYTEAQERITDLSVINEISNSFSTKLNLDEFMKVVDTQINRFIEAQFLLIAAYDPTVDEWEALYANDPRNDFTNIRLKTSQGITGYVINSGKPLLLRSRAEVETFCRRTSRDNIGPTPATYMGAPMIVSGEVLGAVVVQNYEHEDFYDEKTLTLFSTIAAQVAVAFENARLFARMQQMAITDILTGLFSRGHFFLLAETEFERAVRYKKPLSAIMIDLDHFKNVNDTFGHATGDLVLQTISQRCLQTLRKIDIMGRYGGEEFAIVLPETKQEDGFIAAERIRQVISSAEIETPEGVVKITASLGLAVLETGHKNFEALLDCADKALYAAKQAGRNRVKVYISPSLR